MVLLLTAIDQQGELRKFSCQLPDMDGGFDLLTAVAVMGHTLVEARLLEEDSWIQLPPKHLMKPPSHP